MRTAAELFKTAFAMKTFLNFIKTNIVGVLTGVVLAIVVWLFTGFNLWILMAGFVAGYFIVGVTVEYIILFFSDGMVRKPEKKVKIKPDKMTALKMVSEGEIDFVTEDDLYSALSEPDDGGTGQDKSSG